MFSLLLALSLTAATTVQDNAGCQEVLLASGTLDAAEHQWREGYFVIGDVTIMVKPEGAMWEQLRGRLSEGLVLSLKPAKCNLKLERIDR